MATIAETVKKILGRLEPTSTDRLKFISMKCPSGLYKKLSHEMEKYLPIIIILAFISGIFLASISQRFADLVNLGVSIFIDSYSYIAPIVIFLILAPCLAKLLNTREGGAFGSYAILWLALRRFLACIWAVLFTVLIFGFPLLPSKSSEVRGALLYTLHSLAWMATHSPYFMAIWAAIFVGILSYKVSKLFGILDRCARGIENAGQYFEPLTPFLMLAVGAYVYSLPRNLNNQLKLNPGSSLGSVAVLGFNIEPSTSIGMLTIYIGGALLVGICCFTWHLAWVGWAKRTVKGFSIRKYFVEYWARVYPLLWATSSEALATPLNLYLVKKHFPHVKTEVRRLVVGMGSYININGTLICVFIMAGIVASILGLQPSMLELLLCIPLVFLMGYGVPGMPGELILFAGPIAILLSVPESTLPVFLALYIGLQIGLPDSFRTGNNTTDDCLCALLLNETYEEKFLNKSGGYHESE